MNFATKELLLNKRIVTDKGCWEWSGYKSGNPSHKYGRVMCGWKSYSVHRLAMHLWKGFDLESSLCVLHKCDNPPCFNPKHLFIGTVHDNIKDMFRKKRNPKCPSGAEAYRAKLTEQDVVEILTMIDDGIEQRLIAEMYEIAPCHVTELKQGLYWKETWKRYHEAQRN